MEFHETRILASYLTIFPVRLETLHAIGEYEFLDKIEGELDRDIDYPTLKRPKQWCYNKVFKAPPHGSNKISESRTRKRISTKKAR